MAADDFVSGALAGQQFKLNKQAMQLNQLSLDEGQLKVESEGIKLKNLKQLSDIQSAAMKAAMQGHAESKSSNSSSLLFPQLQVAQDVALNEISMGAVDDGMEKLKGVMAIEENQLKITDTIRKQADDKMERVTRLFSGINDDDSPKLATDKFDAAVLAAQGLGETFDPKALNTVRSNIGDKASRDKILGNARSAQQRAKDDYEAARAKAEALEPDRRKAQTELYKSQKARVDELRIRDKKNGNKPVNAAYITAAVAKIKAERPEATQGLDNQRIRDLALPIAEEVEDLMKQPGMTESTALARAWGHQKDDIHMRTGRPQRGTSKDRPLPVPKLGSGRIDRTKLEDGIYYEGLGVWNDDEEKFE